MKSGSLSDDDVTRGKEALKGAIALETEAESGLIDCLAQQAGILGSAQSPSAVCSAIDAITASDVKSAARKIASQKLSIAAVGNLTNVPRLNQIN